MQTTAEMADFFRGMARHNRAAVQDAATYDGWQALAEQLLQRQREDMLRHCTAAERAAIAAGTTSPAAAAQAALTDA